MRKIFQYRCRRCQKIYCYSCSNHWHPGATPKYVFHLTLIESKSFDSLSSQHRLCDYCHEKAVKESLMSNYTLLDDPDKTNETNNEVDLKFEVRSERLNTTTDDQSSSQGQ